MKRHKLYVDDELLLNIWPSRVENYLMKPVNAEVEIIMRLGNGLIQNVFI